jgi:hypothetical protein
MLMKIRRLLLLIIPLCLSYASYATNLGVGGLAITSVNSDGDDDFSFVLLTDISGTTTVYFTERPWDNDQDGGGAAPTWATSTDGTITWTYVGSLPAGTEIQISQPGNSGGTASIGTSSESGSFSLSSSSDVVIAYTGTGVPNNGTEVTNFIWATAWNDPFTDNATASTTSSVPTGLAVGVTAVEFTTDSGDNLQYNCSVVGPDAATLRSAIANSANYNLSDVTTYIAPGCAYLASTTWNGVTWSNGAPSASVDAIIASNTAPGSFTCKDLTINAATALVVSAGATITISGTSVTNNGFGAVAADAAGKLLFDNNGNTITLSGNAHSFRGIVEVSGTTTLATAGLITLTAPSTSSMGQLMGTGTVNGNISMQAFIDASGGGKYMYLGSPMTNAVLSDFNEPGATMVSANSAQGTTWEWDAANAEWDPAGGSNLASTAERGRGYSMYVGMNGAFGPFLIDDGDRTGTVTITGTCTNDATVNSTLSYNDGQAATVNFVSGSTINDTEGWNLVANPYAAIYDWDGQTIPADMSSAIYRFNGTNYSAYVKGVGSASRYIAPMQGFFVQLTDNTPGNLVFDRGNRAPTQSATLTKTTTYNIDGVSLHLEGMGGNVHDDLFVGFEAASSVDFDNEWDARKLSNKGLAPNFYVQLGQSAYSVCRVPLSGPHSFNLKLAYGQDGDNMSIAADLSDLQSFGQVLLEDRKLNVVHNLTLGAYSFVQDNAFGPDRFILHFDQATVGQEENYQHSVYGFANARGLNVELGLVQDATVELYSISGQLIERKEGQNGLVHFPKTANGIYLIKVEAGAFTQTVKVVR